MTIRRYIDTTTGEEKTFSFEIDAIDVIEVASLIEPEPPSRSHLSSVVAPR